MVNAFTPTTLAEALELRAKFQLTPYAGGTDVMVANRPKQTFLFLNRIPELRNIMVDEEYIRIGACVTFVQAMADKRVPAIMREAAAHVGSPAVRNFGTFGGNLANGSDKADTVPVSFALGAKVRLASVRGERIVPVEQFHIRLREVDLAADELIVELLLPKSGWDRYYFHKVGGRKTLAISHATFAGIFDEHDGIVTNVAASFGAVADQVLRFRDIEQMLVGKDMATAKTLKKDYLVAYAERLVTVNGRVSAAYCKTVCLNLLDDFMGQFGI